MPKFPTLNGQQFSKTLTGRMIPVADGIRALAVKFGLRPYRVTIVKTSWSGLERGDGQEMVVSETEILPTPKVADLAGLQEVVTAVGLEELGSVLLTNISGRYTSEQLLGHQPDGTPLADNEQLYYEIEFQQPTGQPGEKRRFFPSSAPTYRATKLDWSLTLEKQRGNRRRNGDLR